MAVKRNTLLKNKHRLLGTRFLLARSPFGVLPRRHPYLQTQEVGYVRGTHIWTSRSRVVNTAQPAELRAVQSVLLHRSKLQEKIRNTLVLPFYLYRKYMKISWFLCEQGVFPTIVAIQESLCGPLTIGKLQSFKIQPTIQTCSNRNFEVYKHTLRDAFW